MSAKLELIYPEHVTEYRDFLLGEIRRIEQSAQGELRCRYDGTLPSLREVEDMRRRVIRQTQPLHDELTQLLSRSTWHIVLAR